jgi:hypothetical protein
VPQICGGIVYYLQFLLKFTIQDSKEDAYTQRPYIAQHTFYTYEEEKGRLQVRRILFLIAIKIPL